MNGFHYGNNPNGYTQREIDQEHIGYDSEIVRDALDGCVLGIWSRRDCSFGDGNGASTLLFEEAGVQSEHYGFVITMPDGSRYNVTVEQVQGPRWAQPEAMESNREEEHK